jgi:hypothetical protein
MATLGCIVTGSNDTNLSLFLDSASSSLALMQKQSWPEVVKAQERRQAWSQWLHKSRQAGCFAPRTAEHVARARCASWFDEERVQSDAGVEVPRSRCESSTLSLGHVSDKETAMVKKPEATFLF